MVVLLVEEEKRESSSDHGFRELNSRVKRRRWEPAGDSSSALLKPLLSNEYAPVRPKEMNLLIPCPHVPLRRGWGQCHVA